MMVEKTDCLISRSDLQIRLKLVELLAIVWKCHRHCIAIKQIKTGIILCLLYKVVKKEKIFK